MGCPELYTLTHTLAHSLFWFIFEYRKDDHLVSLFFLLWCVQSFILRMLATCSVDWKACIWSCHDIIRPKNKERKKKKKKILFDGWASFQRIPSRSRSNGLTLWAWLCTAIKQKTIRKKKTKIKYTRFRNIYSKETERHTFWFSLRTCERNGKKHNKKTQSFSSYKTMCWL